MPGLGTLYGLGGATTHLMDLQHSDLVVIQGSNFAENHPVGFRFVMMAKERGATIVHVDPRYTRTSALADMYIPIRSGTDIAFTGGLINYVLSNDAYFKEYVHAYTNATFLVHPDFRDTEDLEGLFSGYNPETCQYDAKQWRYEVDEDSTERPGAGGASVHGGKQPKKDPTLQHPRCVLNVIKRHYARYTPEMVERVTGAPPEALLRLAKLLVANSGRERTAVYAYAMGWAQHTVGVQNIRAAATLQALLGNTGRPGGGVMALRGHASIQGSTDIATLYDNLPGYLKIPTTEKGETDFATWTKNHTMRSGRWEGFPRYAISQLKAWYGERARASNDWGFRNLPLNTGDHSDLPMFFAMKDGEIEGLVLYGQNPAVGGQNAALQRAAMERLRWLVVRDMFETESAAFWKREGADPTAIGTEVFFLPVAGVAEKEGTFTNTMRLVQYHDKAVEPPDDARSDLAFTYELGKRLKALHADSIDPLDRPILDLTWDYESDDPGERARSEPSVNKIMREMNGFRIATGEHLRDASELRDDGTTACGAWIYCGMFPEPDRNLTRRRMPGPPGSGSPEWAWSWPNNSRTLYNRASADPSGMPWSERKRLVWWDAAANTWTGTDRPDFPLHTPPSYRAPADATGEAAVDGDAPFVMLEYGRSEIFGVNGTADGPLATHYEPRESPVGNALYPKVQFNPVLKQWRRRDNPYHAIGDERYPYVITTYRLTEHHAAGVMSRRVPWLAELQPAVFCELSPELAVEKSIRNGDWVTIETARGEIEARALVTGRMQPIRLGKGRFVHQIGVPYHWGYEGEVTGDSANDLPPLVADPNVTIHEGKAFTCNLRPGRRKPYDRATLEDEPVPKSEQRPLGNPERPGPVAAPPHDSSAVRTAVVPPEVVMEGAALVHRMERGEVPGAGIGEHEQS
ncbi:MAG: Formate dehydrogenase alpha subunit [Candidatus Eremiobacteraeota bacterium]|nr:Formate dehydrogenase alpha subunit [Candidatus Eremiobacteraeota bacterium]